MSGLNLPKPPSSSAPRDHTPDLNAGRRSLKLPVPPVKAQASAGSLQDNEAEISSLRQKLADEKAARRVGLRDLSEAQKEVQDLQTQLTTLQEEQQAALNALREDLTKEQETALAALDQNLTKRYEDESSKAIDDWKNHYEGQVAELRTRLENASQSHGSKAGSTVQLEAALASAKQQIADFQRIKAEEGAAEQRAADAQNLVSSLETQLTAAQAEVASSSQAMQEAKSETQEAKDTCETLQKQLEMAQAAQHKHEKTIHEMLLKTAEDAKQYILDIQDSRSHGEHHDSGGRGHKRSRDSSNGRDKRR